MTAHAPVDVVSGDEATSFMELPSRSARAPWKVLAASLIGVVAVVALFHHIPSGPAAQIQKDSVKATEGLVAERSLTEPGQIESGQYNWQIVTRERDACSSEKENCIASKCCKVSGYHCYGLTGTEAKCQKECIPGDTACTPLSRTLGLVRDYMNPARNLFCFSVYTKETGSPKVSYEKELLTQQYAKKVSIFGCEAYAVYSDVEVALGGDLTTRRVTDVNNDWHFAKRPIVGGWVNTGMFIQVWNAIGKDKVWEKADWVVKVDPDAVFLAERLRNRIQWMPRTQQGSFLQNCKYVDYGFFGNLEVISNLAFAILLANTEQCRTTLPWKTGIKDGKYGPMGEDLFAEICMEKNGVDKVEAFDVTADGACPANRPLDQKKNKKWHSDCKTVAPAMHPFKKPEEWFKCLDTTMAMDTILA